MKIEVLKPGAQSQLQDLGRYGYQSLGVPVCGVMDEWSHRVANLLVGNADDEATLEVALSGPALRFAAATRIAICGADLSPRLQGLALKPNRAVDVPAGAVLEFGACVAGLRAYLAVQGGFAARPWMGSRSTYARGGFGGHEGRALRKGDWLTAPDTPAHALRSGPQAHPLLPDTVPLPQSAPHLVRIVAGEHWDSFTPETQALLTESDYRISPQSDRMGYRLEGLPLQCRNAGELVSEAMNFGTIQVPPDGQPIVLMAERQGTGGYPKIGHVISVDLPLLAQLAPSQRLRFTRVTLDEAQTLYLQREQLLNRLKNALT